MSAAALNRHTSDDAHASRSLADTDPAVREALDGEARRQRTQVELIASENVMSRAVREALGHEMGNKTLEGYPGNRFHGGGEYVDVVERLAIERAKALFGAAYANVQPHSGTQANQAVFFVLLKPGDRILSLDLAAGGHLSHGAGANLSGRWFDSHHYGVERESALLDYDAIEARARDVRPALLIAGGSAYRIRHRRVWRGIAVQDGARDGARCGEGATVVAEGRGQGARGSTGQAGVPVSGVDRWGIRSRPGDASGQEGQCPRWPGDQLPHARHSRGRGTGSRR